MSNHSIDCDFCGKDRRLVLGGACCDAFVAAENEKRNTFVKRANEAWEVLNRWGIVGGGDYKVSIFDVAEVLLKKESESAAVVSSIAEKEASTIVDKDEAPFLDAVSRTRGAVEKLFNSDKLYRLDQLIQARIDLALYRDKHPWKGKEK